MTQVLYGGVLFLEMNTLLAYAVYLAACRLLPDAPTRARLTATASLFIAAVVVTAQVCSLRALYTREVVAAAVLVMAGASHLAWARGSLFERDRVAAGAALRAAAASRGAVLLVVGAVAVVLVGARAAELPPLGWDSLTYHMVFASRFVQAAALGPMNAPYAMDCYDHYPKNGEILASWILLPFHGDLLAGFLNVALLVLSWLAAYDLGRELDLDRADGALAATAVCTSPFLYSFSTTQNPDALVFAALFTASAFLLRFLKGDAPADAFLASVAAGIAIGAKYTALPLAGLLTATLAITFTIRRLRSRSVGKLAAGLAVGGLILCAVGARQYAVNAATTGNPVYPLTLRGGGSPFTDLQLAEKGTGDRMADLRQFVNSLNYYPYWRNVTSAGPKYLVLIPLSLLALARPPRAGGMLVRMLAVFALVGLCVAYLPSGGSAALSRRFWPGSTPRFLAAYFGIFALTGISALARLRPGRADAVRALLVGFIAWDLMRADTSTTARVPLVAGEAALALVLLATWSSRVLEWKRSVWRASAVAACGALLLAVCLMDRGRAASRWPSYATATDVHPIPRTFVAGWRFCDRPAPATIALTAGWDDAGENWFFYPLMGRRLQNTVVYVPLSRAGQPGTRDFVRRENGRAEEWLGQLRDRRVELVFVQAPWPVEDGWMREQPDTFSLAAGDEGFRVYAVRRDARSDG